MQFDVKIRKVIENGKPLKALASVTETIPVAATYHG